MNFWYFWRTLFFLPKQDLWGIKRTALFQTHNWEKSIFLARSYMYLHGYTPVLIGLTVCKPTITLNHDRQVIRIRKRFPKYYEVTYTKLGDISKHSFFLMNFLTNRWEMLVLWFYILVSIIKPFLVDKHYSCSCSHDLQISQNVFFSDMRRLYY